jgi:FkbM family methyltransferase
MQSALSTLARLIAADVKLVASEVANGRRPRQAKVQLHGVVLTLGPWATTPIRETMRLGSYEGPERDVLSSTLRPSDVVLELGTGSGYLTTIAARIATEVRGFDANPHMTAVARATVADNSARATITNGVLSRGGHGTAPFYVSSNFAESSLAPIEGAEVIDVPIFELADALSGCTYMLVDIEGAELELLAGELLGVERICVETHPGITGVARIVEMIDSLRAQGFRLDSEISQGQVLYLRRD